MSNTATPPKNETRVCRNGHRYVTEVGKPGKCWCGAAPKLTLAKE